MFDAKFAALMMEASNTNIVPTAIRDRYPELAEIFDRADSVDDLMDKISLAEHRANEADKNADAYDFVQDDMIPNTDRAIKRIEAMMPEEWQDGETAEFDLDEIAGIRDVLIGMNVIARDALI